MPKLTLQQLEAHLLSAANVLRGRTAGQDYKTYILSLMFFKRLSDQWDNEPEERVKQLEKDRGSPFSAKQREKMLADAAVHRFTIPDGCHWSDVIGAGKDHGAVLTRAMRAIADANAELKGVFTVDWNLPAPDGSGAKLIANEVVVELLNRLNRISLSNEDASADILGRAYEYLIKYFADDAGAKAGEFFTPPKWSIASFASSNRRRATRCTIPPAAPAGCWSTPRTTSRSRSTTSPSCGTSARN